MPGPGFAAERISRESTPFALVGGISSLLFALLVGVLVASHRRVADALRLADRANGQLRERERDLLWAQCTAQLGNWSLDVASRRVSWSEGLFLIWGLDPSRDAPSYEAHRDLMAPGEWSRLDRAVSAAVHEGKPYQIDLGYGREELLGMSAMDIEPPYTRERWDAHWLDLQRAGSMRLESVHRRKDGVCIPVEISVDHFLLRTSLRAGDITCRYGGEEITLVLHGAESAEAAKRLDTLRRAMTGLRLVSRDRELPPISVSIGVETVAPDETDPGRVLARADAAMYRAKRQGRNRVVIAKEFEGIATVRVSEKDQDR